MALKSICKIKTATQTSSGFLLKLFKNEEDFFCLITNEHVITKEMISNKDKIEFYYDDENKIKIINLDKNERYIKEFTEINLDIVIIEIKSEDNINEEYFLLPDRDYIDNYNDLKEKEISILQFPNGDKLSFSKGKIKEINKYEITHLSITQSGSSGSPIFLIDSIKVIGIQKQGNKNNDENYGDLLGPIFNYFKNNLKYKLENGNFYNGDMKDGLKCGKGIEYDKNENIIYNGEFVNDKYEGQGKYIYENGEYYIGQFKNGLENGKGIKYYMNGNIKYDGDMVNGKAEGNGKYIYENDEYYIGQFKNDLKHGKGTIFYENGNIKYDGEFINDNYKGNGNNIFENYRRYIEQKKNDLKEEENNNKTVYELRCPYCYLIPYIKLNKKENILEYKCPKSHYDKNDFLGIYNLLKININEIICECCNEKMMYYSIEYGRLFCKKRKLINSLKKKRCTLIPINKIDNFCFYHDKLISKFCIKHNISLCEDCNHEKKECQIVSLKDIIIKEGKLDSYIMKLNQMNKTKLDDSNNIYYQFYKDLLDSYIYNIKNKKCYNYNNINNIIINFNLQPNEPNDININKLLLSSFNEVKKNKIIKLENNNYYITNKFTIEENVSIIKTISYNNILITVVTILKDKRISLGFEDSKFIVLNKNTYEIDILIDDKLSCIYSIIQLKNGNVCISYKTLIRVLEINNKNYKIIQDIEDAHKSSIYSLIETSSNELISCSYDKTVKIWNKEDNKDLYSLSYTIRDENIISNVLEIKENEIVFDVMGSMEMVFQYFNQCSLIRFYDYEKRKEIKTIENLRLNVGNSNRMALLNNCLAIVGHYEIYIFNIYNYRLIRKFKVEQNLRVILKLNEDMILSGDTERNLLQLNIMDNEILMKETDVDFICALGKVDNKIIVGGKGELLVYEIHN